MVNGLVDDKCLRRVGDSCAVTCDPRYRLKEENKTVMCTTNTTWDDEIPCEGRKLHKSNKGGKDQESIQSSTTPDPGYHMTWKVRKTQLNIRNKVQEVSPFSARHK